MTTLPHPACTITGIAGAHQPHRAPSRGSPTAPASPHRSAPRSRERELGPALLTSTSRRPKRSRQASTTRSPASGAVTSSASHSAPGRSASAARSASGSQRGLAAGRAAAGSAPSATSDGRPRRPMPREPPRDHAGPIFEAEIHGGDSRSADGVTCPGLRHGCCSPSALAPVHQQYLLQARQMQALSFAVHIPLVAFGISFPVMVLFVEWLGMRTGDPLYRTLARRWSRVMVALFAVGRDHRDDPELRDGAAVAELHRHLRRRVRAGFRDRGLLVLHGGDLHRDLRLRLGPPVAAGPLRSAGSRS